MMLVKKIIRLLSAEGYHVAAGKFAENRYAVVNISDGLAAVQIHTNQKWIADDYELTLKTGGLKVTRTPAAFRTLYIKLGLKNET